MFRLLSVYCYTKRRGRNLAAAAASNPAVVFGEFGRARGARGRGRRRAMPLVHFDSPLCCLPEEGRLLVEAIDESFSVCSTHTLGSYQFGIYFHSSFFKGIHVPNFSSLLLDS